MAFQIHADESVARGVRRIVRDQIDRALEGLTGRDPADEEEAIHDARKRIKRIRAVLRLARGAFGRGRATRENVRFRDLGRRLAGVRDATVLVRAFDGLVGRPGDPGRAGEFAPVREQLVRSLRDVTREVLGEGEAVELVARGLVEARRDARGWKLRGEGWDPLAVGLDWIYRKGRRAFAEASKCPTDAALHEWRKRVKDLWHAAEVLRPIRPGPVSRLVDQAHKLADALGDDHDLAVLREVFPDPDGGCGDVPVGRVIVPRIERRRAELQAEALRLGQSLYEEQPRAFLARFGAYWLAWRSEIDAARYDQACEATPS